MIEFHLFGKDSKDNSQQFIPGSDHGFSVDHTFRPFSEVIIPEDAVVPDNRTGNEITNSSQAANSPFGYFSFFNHIPRLFNAGVCSRVSNELLSAGEAVNVFNFTEEVAGGSIADAFNGFENFQFIINKLHLLACRH